MLDKEIRKQRESIIAKQHNGIYPVYEVFYIRSIIYAADRSEAAFQRFEIAATKADLATLTFATLQEALTHAGALSRFFWPVKKSLLTDTRGNRLREAFGLDDNSPLVCRNLRNKFEHFDEHLDSFLLQDLAGTFLPDPLVDTLNTSDTVLDNTFKLVDPEEGVCVLLGEKFEFQSIRSEVQRILSCALEMEKQGGRLKRYR